MLMWTAWAGRAKLTWRHLYFEGIYDTVCKKVFVSKGNGACGFEIGLYRCFGVWTGLCAAFSQKGLERVGRYVCGDDGASELFVWIVSQRLYCYVELAVSRQCPDKCCFGAYIVVEFMNRGEQRDSPGDKDRAYFGN
jgi:hypothetical protein